MVIFVRTQGAKIVKEGKHLLVRKDNAVHNTLFTYKLEQVVLMGNVEVTHGAMIQLLRHGVDTVFLTRDGRYLGRLASPEAKNIFIRRRQFQLADDPEFGLTFARQVVSGKLANMATLLMRIKRTRGSKRAEENARQITKLYEKIQNAPNVDSLRGYEGSATALFFSGFQHGFIRDMGFRKRVRRPPTDPVNSLLSLLYTFLMNRVYAAVRLAGLDPYMGFLHTPDYGRYSLVLDLMEEFRSIIAETLVLSLFNLNILKDQDFIVDMSFGEPEEADEPEECLPDVTLDPIGRMSPYEDDADAFDLPEQAMDKTSLPEGPSDGKYPVKLQGEAFKRVVEAFQNKLSTRFYYHRAEREVSYQDAIIFQAGLYRKLVEGEAAAYQPLLLK